MELKTCECSQETFPRLTNSHVDPQNYPRILISPHFRYHFALLLAGTWYSSSMWLIPPIDRRRHFTQEPPADQSLHPAPPLNYGNLSETISSETSRSENSRYYWWCAPYPMYIFEFSSVAQDRFPRRRCLVMGLSHRKIRNRAHVTCPREIPWPAKLLRITGGFWSRYRLNWLGELCDRLIRGR